MQVDRVLSRGNCYNCQQPGHLAQNCPFPRKPPRIPRTDVRINNTSTSTVDELEALVAQLRDTIEVKDKELGVLKEAKADFVRGKE